MKKTLIVFIVVLFALVGCGEKDSQKAFELTDFVSADETFCYNDLTWGMTLEEVEKSLGRKLTAPADGTSADEWKSYTDENEVSFSPFIGKMNFDFNNNLLKNIVITLTADCDYAKEHEKLLSSLNELYGKPTQTLDKDRTVVTRKMHFIENTWEREQTFIQLSFITSENDDPTLRIGSAAKT